MRFWPRRKVIELPVVTENRVSHEGTITCPNCETVYLRKLWGLKMPAVMVRFRCDNEECLHQLRVSYKEGVEVVEDLG